MRWSLALAGLALLTAGCDVQFDPIGGRRPSTSTAAPPAAVVEVPADDVSSLSCDVAPPGLTGEAPPGAACVTASDCAAVCCDCGEGTTSWLAATCIAGTCAGADVACGRTLERYCGAPATSCEGLPAPATSCEACEQTYCCAQTYACDEDATCDADALDACIRAVCAAECG